MAQALIRRTNLALIMCQCIVAQSCQDSASSNLDPATATISTDRQLYEHVTLQQSSGSYKLFPDADSVVAGTLNGSDAHRPTVRVSLNAVASEAVRSGRLPAGTGFPDRSIVLKEIRQGGQTVLYAVLYKQRNNPLTSGGWLWAELRPDGTALYSIQEKGIGCIGCHSREQGLQNDLVRTFERQR